MNFEFSEEHSLLRDQARGFLAKSAPLSLLRDGLDGEGDRSALWRGVSELGWPATAIPEAYGGLGLGYLELCVLSEEIGRALAGIPFSSSVYLVSELLLREGSEEQKEVWLPKLAAGDAVGALAVQETAGALSPAGIFSRLENGRLNGHKVAVTDGAAATLLLALAKAAEGPTLCLIDLASSNVECEHVPTIDGGRPAANFGFYETPVEVIGRPGEGWRAVNEVFDRAAIFLAFEQLGGAERAMESAVSFAKDRRAFGQPIGAFQAIKHKLADLYVLCELARANAYYGAWALHTDAAELPLAAAAARIAACEAFATCSAESIQVHGGMGFTWESDCHLFYRRAKLLDLILGPPMIWKERLMRQIEHRNAA